MTIKFTHIDDTAPGFMIPSKEEITMTTHAVELHEIIEVFERFLKAMGFSYDGRLDFVDDCDHDDEFPTGERP